MCTSYNLNMNSKIEPTCRFFLCKLLNKKLKYFPRKSCLSTIKYGQGKKSMFSASDVVKNCNCLRDI